MAVKKQAPVVVDAEIVRKRVRGCWTKIQEKLTSGDMLKLSGGKVLVKRTQLNGSLKDYDLITEVRLVPRRVSTSEKQQELIAGETQHLNK